MANLESSYMGIPLKNPFVMGACSLTAHMDSIRKINEMGAGALVIQSLFEEQIQLQKYKLEEDVQMYDNWHAEMTDIFPDVKHGGPEEHLMWVRKAKEASSIPVIASLNAVQPETWADWAFKLEQTGVDGLELNFFSIPINFERSAADIEKEQIDALTAVRKKIKIPVSVKLSPFYTSPLEIIKKMDGAGVSGVVLFNRLFHPSFDIEKESSSFPFNLSSPADHRLPLRFVGLLAGNIKASICASNGIHSGADAVEVLLAGADVFQAVSTVYRNGVDVIPRIIREVEEWMARKGYSSLADFRGKLSVEKNPDRFAYKRAQYVRMLLRSDEYIKRPKLI
jgi:dihydroorotate dehydrogenase (fumarate)